MVSACDISQYQGNWQDRGDPIVMIKMGGGDAGLYMDPKATQNYEGAVKAGRAVGGYWFGGGGNADAEAAFFLKCMSPLAENDVYALDVEAHLATLPNVVAWVETFNNYIHSKIGVWPLVYMNLSTLNAHDWTPVLKYSGLWLADWAVPPTQNIPTSHTYVMQQYSDGPVYDHDEWFGTIEQFKAYGYHAPVAAVVPKPTPTPVVTPAPKPVSTPTPAPTPAPAAPTLPTEPAIVPPTSTPVQATTQTPPETNTPLSTDSASTLSNTPPNTISHTVSQSGWWARLRSAIIKIFK